MPVNKVWGCKVGRVVEYLFLYKIILNSDRYAGLKHVILLKWCSVKQWYFLWGPFMLWTFTHNNGILAALVAMQTRSNLILLVPSFISILFSQYVNILLCPTSAVPWKPIFSGKPVPAPNSWALSSIIIIDYHHTIITFCIICPPFHILNSQKQGPSGLSYWIILLLTCLL